MKTFNDEIKNPGSVEELDDDALDGIAGGLVQLVNPSSSRLGEVAVGKRTTFKDKRTCPVCGSTKVLPTEKVKKTRSFTFNVVCNSCSYFFGIIGDSELENNS